jgi:cytochrome c556
MLSSPRSARLLVPALLSTAGLAVAGCGGGGGGNEADYVKTYEGACKNIVTATTDFQKSATGLASTAASDPNKAVSTLKEGATKLFTTFGESIQTLADADAPKKWSDFQDSVKKGADSAKKGIDQAKAEVAKIKTINDFSTLGSKFDKIDLGNTKDLPKELGEKAPSCKSFGSSTSSS